MDDQRSIRYVIHTEDPNVTFITDKLATMRGIVNAANGRDLTKAQTADYRTAMRDVLDYAEDNLDAPAVKALGSAVERGDDLSDIVTAIEGWYVSHGRKSAGRVIENAGPIGFGSSDLGFSTPQGMRSSYKSKLDWGREFTQAREASGTKALLDPGTTPVTVPLAAEPVTDPRQAQFVYQLVPTEDAPSGMFSYLRQSARTNLAAVVASGALKPESVYSLARVDSKTVVIAHVSEAIDRFMIEDAPMLQAFLNQELVYGLNKALDARVVANIRTAATAGSTTLNLAGIRTAITTLQAADLDPTAIVVNPTDWQAIESSAATQFASNDNFPAATEAMQRRLYGLSVVVTNSTAAGKALVGDFAGSARIFRTGGASISMHDSHPRTVSAVQTADFRLNQIVVRCEMRAEAVVLRPSGFVRVGLA